MAKKKVFQSLDETDQGISGAGGLSAPTKSNWKLILVVLIILILLAAAAYFFWDVIRPIIGI